MTNKQLTKHFDLIVRGGTVVTTDTKEACDIGIQNGKILELGSLSQRSSVETIDAKGLHILPGIIDSQVHFREPGNELKEDMLTGSKAAILGGVTTVFEMPNTSPPTTTEDAFKDKLRRAKGRYHCDYGFFVGASPENIPSLPALEKMPGCSGVKIFMGSSTGSLLIPTDELLSRVLESGVRRAAVHSEDEERMNQRMEIRDSGGGVELHPIWRDAETAIRSTTRLIKLAKARKRPVHVLHVTTSQEIDILEQARDIATVECTPQHLTLFSPDCYDRLGTYAQMNPPIRDEKHRQGLWRGIRDGIVDAIGSDHAPHTHEEKALDYPESPSGMPGVQTLLPIMLDHMNAGRLTLQRLIHLTSLGPSRLYGLANKGKIEVGYDADLTLVDLKSERRISRDWLASKCDWSPFLDQVVTGWPVTTILRGRPVVRNSSVVSTPTGQAVHFA
jgi:dihydroorotase